MTGATRGIGHAIAVRFAKEGASIAFCGRSRSDAMVAVEQELNALGVTAKGYVCDVADYQAVQDFVKQVVAEFGRVDILINNAGTGAVDHAENITDEQFQKEFDVDLFGTFKFARAVANHAMIPAKYGRIINIASMYGLVGNTALDTVAYHSSKGGVVNFTRAVAAELAKYNITCNAICPGYFDTELTHDTLVTDEFTAYMKQTVPLGRYGNKGELNAGAIFLASDEASYVTGVILPIDGGYTAV